MVGARQHTYTGCAVLMAPRAYLSGLTLIGHVAE